MPNGLVALALSWTLAAAAPPTLSRDAVAAAGEQDVVLRVPQAGMVRLTVDSPTGTACTLVDHLRGPFLDDGVVGKEGCAVDALLDAGQYKVRLHSPPWSEKKKAPTARVSATAFEDVDAPAELQRGRSSVVTLPSGRQVVRWLRLSSRQEVTLEAAGRTAGRLSVWRDGAWLEDLSPRSEVARPLPGRPVHWHTLTTVLDPGEYAVVVHGTEPQRFSVGVDDDTAYIGWDAPPASPSRSALLVVPTWGFTAVRAPAGALGAFLTVEGARSQPVSLHAIEIEERSGIERRGDSTICVVEPSSAVPSCGVRLGSRATRATILEVQGPPGTVARVVWGPTGTDALGSFVPADEDLRVQLPAAVDGLQVAGLPASIDATPVGCVLERLDDKGGFQRTVARDLPEVTWTQAWKRSFNSDGAATSVWLNIARPGLYSFTANDALGATCEVLGLGDDDARPRLLAPTDGACRARVTLGAGPIEVRLYGGRPGIQTLRVGQVGLSSLGSDVEAPARTGCTFATSVGPGRYRVRTNGTGGAALRTASAPGLGVGGESMVIAVDPNRTVTVPIAAGADVAARNGGPGTFSCAVDGRPLPGCATGALSAPATLTLTSTGDRPAVAVIARAVPSSSPPALPSWTATPPRLPVVAEGKTAWFDLDDTAAKNFVVNVTTPGLYDLETEGLLATSCAVRTATSASLFSGERNGRGRNCLVQSYLKPGSYLVSVRALGSSKGRAGLRLTPRAAWAGGDLVVGDERFVRVDAATPARHPFTLKKDTVLRGGVTAQNATLSCRLDDDDGWPVKAVPHACTFAGEALLAGRYVLNVLPLTVESRRGLRLGEQATTATLTGETLHDVALNTAWRAQLSADGKDQFRFTLAGDAEVAVELGAGMQGRLYPLDARGQRGEVRETIAPVGGGAFSLAASVDEDAVNDDGVADGGDGGDDGEVEGDAGEGDGDVGDGGEYVEEGGGPVEGEGASDAEVEAPRYRPTKSIDLRDATVHQPVPAPAGQRVSLPAGTWLLETESASGDVAVGYGLRIGTATLLPGVALQARAPAVIAVAAPARADAGLVRLRTRGATDVACRLVDEAGAIVGESRSSGADWNCALAVPLSAGASYRLFVDAEVLQPGPVTVLAEFLEAKDTGVMKDGDTFRVVGKVVQATVPSTKGQVTDVLLASADEFSCAAFDEGGRLLDRQIATRSCSLLLWPGDDDRPFRVMAWTEDRPASLKASVGARGVRGAGGLFGASVLDDRSVVELTVPHRGRYATGPATRCLPKKTRGALTPCPQAASFDPAVDGDRVLVGGARGDTSAVAFEEVVARLEVSSPAARDERVLGPRPVVERARSTAPALHLVDVRALPGSAAAPACAIAGGAHTFQPSRCAAATGPQADSELSLWTAPGGRVPVQLWRRAVAVPAAQPLVAGTVALAGPLRLGLPAEPFRLDVAAPADAWVVLLDDAARAVDLCPPAVDDRRRAAAGLGRCVLRGRGGSVVLAPSTSTAAAARIDLLRFAAADEAPRDLVGVREVRPRGPGREHLRLAAAERPRLLRVEGRGVRACLTHLQDGTTLSGCSVTVPAHKAGEIFVEHDERWWRAALGAEGDVYGARFGAIPPATTSSTTQPAGRAEPFAGHVVERAVTTRGAGLLRVRATGGVCGVVRGGRVVASEGLGGGCDLAVVVDADATSRVIVRGFGGGAASGTLSWSFEPAPTLAEGVGPETLVQPGEARLFRVDLAADGELGVGLQTDGEVLDCALLSTTRGYQAILAEGCQQFGRHPRGTYWLRVALPVDASPRRFKPVVFGLQGADIDVPDEWLRDFFRRVPPPQADASAEVRR
jgi:hypothetical protein